MDLDKMKQIPNFPDYLFDESGEIYIKWKDKFASKEYRGDGDGYQYLGVINQETGERDLIEITPLIAKTFVPNPENYRFIRHINGIKFDNKASNLVWVKTRAEVVAPTRKRMSWERSVRTPFINEKQKMRRDCSYEAMNDEVINA